MLRKIFQTLCLLGLVIVFASFVGSVDLTSNSFAEGMELGDGAVTGMTVDEVKEAFDDTDNPNLEPQSVNEDRGFDIYHREGTNSYYFFMDGVLHYKLMFFDDEREDSMKNKLEEAYGEPVVEDSVYFYADGNEGYKVMDYDEDLFQLWYGDIEMWNRLAEDSDLHEFPD